MKGSLKIFGAMVFPVERTEIICYLAEYITVE